MSGHSYHKTPTFEEAGAALERDIRTEAIKDAIGTLMSNIKFFTPTKPGEKAIPAPEGGTPVLGNATPALEQEVRDGTTLRWADFKDRARPDGGR